MDYQKQQDTYEGTSAEKENFMTTITDEQMKERLSQTKSYTLLLLKKTEKYAADPEVRKVIWEHGRRNMQLGEDGILPIVCPVRDESEIAGICIFTASLEEVQKMYEEDPAIKAGYLSFEVHPCSGFPGSMLPK